MGLGNRDGRPDMINVERVSCVDKTINIGNTINSDSHHPHIDSVVTDCNSKANYFIANVNYVSSVDNSVWL